MFYELSMIRNFFDGTSSKTSI